jgi:hypothetical protein
MEISIVVSKITLIIVKCLLHSQPPCGIIRTTDDFFIWPYFFFFIQQNDQDMAQMLWHVIDLQMDLYYHSLSLFVRASSSVVVACPLLLGWIG